jgi:hypothetical protein
LSLQEIPSIRLIHFVSKDWTLLVVSAIMVQLSQPYNRMDITTDLNSVIFTTSQLLCNIIYACLCIYCSNMYVERQSFVRVEPRHLKASSCWQFQ